MSSFEASGMYLCPKSWSVLKYMVIFPKALGKVLLIVLLFILGRRSALFCTLGYWGQKGVFIPSNFRHLPRFYTMWRERASLRDNSETTSQCLTLNLLPREFLFPWAACGDRGSWGMHVNTPCSHTRCGLPFQAPVLQTATHRQ